MSVPKPILSDGLAEAAIAVPIGYADVAADRRSAARLREWLLTAMLFLVPFVTYWPATFHDYGLRDDYSNLREAHEEPGKVVQFCASHARPIYGWLLQSTYGQTGSVQNLQWMRCFASLLLGAISLLMFRGLRALGWSFNASLCVAMLLSLLPSSQVMAAWAVGWPYAAAALLPIGAYFTVEGALAMGLRAGRRRAVFQWMVGRGIDGGQCPDLPIQRVILRGAHGRGFDCSAASQPRANGALVRRPFGIHHRLPRSRLRHDVGALCGGHLRQVGARRLRA